MVGRRRSPGQLVSLEDRVSFELVSALAMPFAAESFDGAYSMNVSMNIADKGALYREIHRVLKPGARLVLSEIAQGEGGALARRPARGAPRPAFSRRRRTHGAGSQTQGSRSRSGATPSAENRAFGERSRAMVERGERPPHRAVALFYGGEMAGMMAANMSRGLREGRIVPIEVVAEKR